MRYLVRARVRRGQEEPLLKAIEDRTLGEGSVAEGEYLRNMGEARVCDGDVVKWVEVCYCSTPLLEEYFELVRVQDAHDRGRCRDQNGSEPWACGGCDCSERLERKLAAAGKPFVDRLRAQQLAAAVPSEPAEELPSQT